jgi:hypothetical protein
MRVDAIAGLAFDGADRGGDFVFVSTIRSEQAAN